MTPDARSPYEVVLGESLASLHPRLRAYFSAIPAGHIGIGEGVFRIVGTPRRWLWPALWILRREGVLFPVWERDVSFTVVNRPATDENGNSAVMATRSFHFRSGRLDMTDAITTQAGSLVDHLGVRRRLTATLDAGVIDGSLQMTSTMVALRVGRSQWQVPHWLSPVVTLVEQFDDEEDAQHVSVQVVAPVIGRLYEYAGSFSYEVRPGEASA